MIEVFWLFLMLQHRDAARSLPVRGAVPPADPHAAQGGVPRHGEPRAPRAGRVSAVRRASPGSRWLLLLVFAAFLAAGGVAGAVAQSSGATLRLAFLPEWVLEQHRRMGGAVRPELRAALDRGVVDRVVFWWQPGIVHRPARLSWTPRSSA